MTKLLIFFLLIIGILSCKKPHNEMPELPEAPPNIKRILFQTKTTKITGNVIATRLYNNIGKLYLETTKDDLTGLEMYQSFYYREGKLYRSDISNENRKLSKIEYEYLDDNLIRMRFFEFDQYQNSELNFERNFEYRKGLIYKITTQSSDGLKGEFVTFTMADGNVAGIKTYSAYGQLLNAFQFEYDNKVNPYFGQPDYLQSYIGYSKSNVVKSIYNDFSTNNFSKISLFKYEYNISNQPVASFLLDDSGTKQTVMTFEYK